MSNTPMSPQTMKLSLRPTDVIVAVMGLTGSGKSTFISQCVGQNLGIIGHGLQGFTQEVSCHMFTYSESVNVYLVDTPGFDDTTLTDSDVLKAIATWMGDTYQNKIMLNGIIYLHRITDPRMQGSALKNLHIFRKLCGKDAFKNVTLATTMWEAVSLEDGERRERELLETPDFWKPMYQKDAVVARHYNNRQSAMAILERFMRKEPIVTSLQEEMVNGKKELVDTEAGMELNTEYRKIEERLKKDLEATMEGLRAALQEKDKETAAELERCRMEVNEKLNKVQMEREDLKVDLAKLLAATKLFRAMARSSNQAVNEMQQERNHNTSGDDLREHGKLSKEETTASAPRPQSYDPNGGYSNRTSSDQSSAAKIRTRPARKRDMVKAIFGRGPRVEVTEVDD
ncbi:P-loop containing nucleoside triphosphate hydrolase protein [Sordaria brevicollis]|uniref:P-loop containing nucleoside triphosphate hydrolase protein n=1 Tax=Sordaria brevicollis TaxID=83679 RepID=A0AAE0UFJ1_SORBR|nr:P-loop containing nucleoside triphosphate hydrolase protein [Sordaria brevicollis]